MNVACNIKNGDLTARVKEWLVVCLGPFGILTRSYFRIALIGRYNLSPR